MEKKEKQEKKPDKHLRRKLVRIEEDLLIKQALAIAHGIPGWQMRGLPKDFEVLAIYSDYSRRCLAFVICSDEWPLFHDGMTLEVVPIEIVEVPVDASQFVLWQRITGGINDQQEALNAFRAVEEVTSKEWSDDSAS